MEENKISLTPFAISKDGTFFFCCDTYISELVDTGTDLFCLNETIYFLYNSLDKIGKYINFEKCILQKILKSNPNNNEKSSFSKELEIKNVCYYYIEKSLNTTILITKKCNFFYLFFYLIFMIKFLKLYLFN